MMPVVATSSIHARVDLTRAQMQLVIAEASQQVELRAETNMRKARHAAQTLRELARAYDELSEEMRAATSQQVLRGPQCVVVYRAVECLAGFVEPFRASVRSFLAEHGALVEEDSRESVEKLCDWALSLPGALRPLWLLYINSYEEGLAAAADEQSEMADEWAAVELDGLDDAA